MINDNTLGSKPFVVTAAVTLAYSRLVPRVG